MTLYFGKISSSFPEQIQENFYAAGPKGNEWYGGIQPGDYVFPIYQGKIDRLWKVKEYTNKPNKINKDGIVTFEVIRKFDEPVRLSDEFLRYKYFELDLNLLNKSSKSVKNCGFLPIDTDDNCPKPELIEFKGNLRNVYIVLEGMELKYREGDIRVVISDLEETNIIGIEIYRENKFKTYDVLWNLYNEKNLPNERYGLKELLGYATKDKAPNKEKYIRTVLQELQDSGYFLVTSPIALYDNILVGRKKSATSKKSYDVDPESPDDPMEEDLSDYEKYADLLLFNPNIILYGPPGTGKTYATKKIVESFEKKYGGQSKDFETIEKEGRARFVTFHQAYSYEEFIEGIRPHLGDDEDSSGDVKYVIENGILKQLAISASRQTLKAEAKVQGLEYTNESSKIWKVSLGNRSNDAIYNECKISKQIAIGWLEKYDLKGKNYEEIFSILKKERGNSENPTNAASCLNAMINEMNIGDVVLIYDSPMTIRDIGVINGEYTYKAGKTYPHTRRVSWVKEFNKPENIYEYNGQKRLTLKTIYELDRINFSDISKMVRDDSIEARDKNGNSMVPYYLIIDEINRGNIAKIFGELITLIEKDKRETTNCYLPYSKKPFTLPSNLYLIGTMNTADRSIALLDTALRRRFAFIEIEPDISIFDNPSIVVSAKVNDTIELSKLLSKLNDMITQKLDRDHRIGHSYFMDIVGLSDLYKVWYYKIIPLLMEYFYNDIETLNSIIGDKFINREGSLVFLSTKPQDGEVSEFEKALQSIYMDGGI